MKCSKLRKTSAKLPLSSDFNTKLRTLLSRMISGRSSLNQKLSKSQLELWMKMAKRKQRLQPNQKPTSLKHHHGIRQSSSGPFQTEGLKTCHSSSVTTKALTPSVKLVGSIHRRSATRKPLPHHLMNSVAASFKRAAAAISISKWYLHHQTSE